MYTVASSSESRARHWGPSSRENDCCAIIHRRPGRAPRTFLRRGPHARDPITHAKCMYVVHLRVRSLRDFILRSPVLRTGTLAVHAYIRFLFYSFFFTFSFSTPSVFVCFFFRVYDDTRSPRRVPLNAHAAYVHAVLRSVALPAEFPPPP